MWRKQPNERLFSVFTQGKDGHGQSCLKWYNRTFVKQAAIARDFHSYRHTVSSALDRQRVSERVINALLGHAPGKSMSLRVYGHELRLANLRDAINKLPMNPGRKRSSAVDAGGTRYEIAV